MEDPRFPWETKWISNIERFTGGYAFLGIALGVVLRFFRLFCFSWFGLLTPQSRDIWLQFPTVSCDKKSLRFSIFTIPSEKLMSDVDCVDIPPKTAPNAKTNINNNPLTLSINIPDYNNWRIRLFFGAGWRTLTWIVERKTKWRSQDVLEPKKTGLLGVGEYLDPPNFPKKTSWLFCGVSSP